MSKRDNKKTLNPIIEVSDSSSDANNLVVTIIIALYLLIECLPKLQLQDQMGIHWLLLSIVNAISLIYIFSSKSLIDNRFLTNYLKNGISIVYIIFFIIAGISLFVAINPVEGIVVYSRLFTSILCFLIIGILLINRIQLLKNIALIITIIAAFQAFETVTMFYREVGKTPIDTLIYNLQGTSGNKNIFAAAFVIKIPFIIYCIF
ncbi:MAG: hypothetical protein EOO93_28305, partial [Pedobacter sp.]